MSMTKQIFPGKRKQSYLHFLCFISVKHLPPRPPSVSGRPCSGGFQNRGRLFSTLRQQLTSDGIHAQQTSTEQSSPPPPVPNNTPKISPLIHRRVQSAKARLEMCNTQNPYPSSSNAVAIPGKDLAVYDVNKNLTIERKPARRSSRSLGGDSNQFIHHNISLDKSANRPSSAKSSCWTSAPISLAVEPEEKEEKVAEDLKPSVFGYRLKRQVYGSNPDIFASGLLALQPATMFKLDETYKKPSKKDHAEGNPDAASCSRYEILLYLLLQV